MNQLVNQNTIVQKLGIQSLNPMQIETIEKFNTHESLVLLSPTGSGKTIAFLLSLIQKLSHSETGIQALIITPTRELALQIEQVFKSMGTPYKINATYGGHSIRIEKNNFSTPPAVLVGTPGRLLDHISRENIDVSKIHTLVLDEFDKSLEMGFEEDMSQIIGSLHQLKFRMLVSATDSDRIPAFTGTNNPIKLSFLTQETADNIRYFSIETSETQKMETLFELLCNIPTQKTIIFCNHREVVVNVHEFLSNGGIHAMYYHGGMEQEERERSLIKFRNGSAYFLVATDLAARGLDISEVKHVIHFQLPSKEAEFTHRSGRTGRQTADGVVFVFKTEKEYLPEYMPRMKRYDIIENEPLPDLPMFKTIYIGGGKKDKINKVDVVGFLHKTGGLRSEDIGVISVMDHSVLVAINTYEVEALIHEIRDEKIKGKRFKIGFAR
jgi:superfamily II DNA/RNA helicase